MSKDSDLFFRLHFFRLVVQELTVVTPLGLYFKLHGTHRPNSMKKTVIKRRKRVPAAGGSPSAQDRMSDQAAAAILASVGRPHGSQTGAEDSAEEPEGQPRKKRARKSKAEKEREAMEVDELGESKAGARAGTAGRSRKGTGRGRGGGSADSNLPTLEGSVQGEAGPSSLPADGKPLPPLCFPFGYSLVRLFLGSRGMPFPPNPHGGFDLPPLTAALADGTYREHGMNPPAPFNRPGSAGFAPHPPSRTHSPLAGPGVNPAAPQPYHLPPPVPTHPHGHPGYHFYPGMPAPGPAGPAPPMPTYVDLERHFADLEREKRQLQELLDRTERMMAGLRRGMDDMRMYQQPPPPPPNVYQPQHHQPQPPHGVAHAQPGPQGPQHLPAQAEAVPLNRAERSSSSTQSRESVWPVNPPDSGKRD